MRSRETAAGVALMIALSSSAAAAEHSAVGQLDEVLKSVVVFDYGKDTGTLDRAEGLVVAAAANQASRKAAEERLLAALASAKTSAAKAFLCRQLLVVATARSIPQLEAMLSDPGLSHMARYVLGRLEEPEASTAMHRALGKTSGVIQAGIVGTLADSHYRKATPDFVKLLGSSDSVVAEAAASALGRIGGAQAVEALEKARPKAKGPLAVRIDGALLACADQLLAGGDRAGAARIYRAFYAANQPRHMRIAALRRLVAAEPARALSLVVDAVRSNDPQLCAAAVDCTRVMKGDIAKTMAGLLPSLAVDTQPLLLRALGRRGDHAALPAVAAAAKSPDEEIGIAALEALGGVGNASVIGLLAQAAATLPARQQQAARESLVRLRPPEINAAMIHAVDTADSKTRVEIIRALAARKATNAVPDLLKMAGKQDPATRHEAIRALGTLITESELSALVSLALNPANAGDHAVIEQAVGAVFLRIPDKGKQTDVLLSVLSRAPAEAKPVLIGLLVQPATAKGLQAIRAAIDEGPGPVQAAAARALADWPDPAAAPDLLGLAGKLTEPALKLAALRGYVRMAGRSKDPPAMYRQALDLASTPEHRKLVLSGLGEADSAEALELVEQHFNDESLRAEAATAAVQIANRLRAKNSSRAKAALNSVLALDVEPRIHQQATEVINQIEQFEGYILDWLASPRYQEKGKEAGALFDMVFPPEPAEARDIKWTRLTRGIGSWDINLGEAISNVDNCTVYLRARVLSPVEQEARLELGSDDSIKVWLNGSLVHANKAERGVAPRQDIVKVRLKEGANELLLKVTNREGGWAFCCRVRKPDGRALEGLKVQTD